MTLLSDDERLARAALTTVAAPGDPTMGELLLKDEAVTVLDMIRTAGRGTRSMTNEATTRRLQEWAHRLRTDGRRELEAVEAIGGYLVCPGEARWPRELYRLGPDRPIALWIWGTANPAEYSPKAIAIKGTRACTAYGAHVARELAFGLAEVGWTVATGAEYGIDRAALDPVLMKDAPSVILTAAGLDVTHPAPLADLFAAARANGVMISEVPPGTRPTLTAAARQIPLLAALARGTVLVEAEGDHMARELVRCTAQVARPLMVVPGPITAKESGPGNRLLRDRQARCVPAATDVGDIIRQHETAVQRRFLRS